jgi:murein DD-endopeptidase MepM/ murein hydrolase activator NlpD
VDANGFIFAFVVKLLTLSLKSTVTIGLIMALRRFFTSRKKARFNHILWFALLVQLALPFELQTGWSPYRFIPVPGPRIGAQAVSGTAQEPDAGAVYADTPDAGISIGSRVPAVFAVLFAVWISGAAVSGLRTMRIRSGFARKISRAAAIRLPGTLGVFEKAKSSMRLKSHVRLLQSPDVSTPCVYGIFKNAVLLPEGLAERFSEKELECVFLHELSHVMRKDLWLDALVTVFGIVYWFHPVVAAAFRALRRDREYACDAAAITALGGEGAGRYGSTLLHALERFSSPSPQCALGKMDNKTHLRRRITMIASFDGKPSRRYQMGAALFAAVVLVFGSMAAGAQEARSILFRPPVQAANITLDFGWTVNPLTGKQYFHEGIDTAEPVGTQVVAVADGKVVTVAEQAGDDLGFHVVLRHADGFSSMYAKLQRIDVKVGQEVKAGQTVGSSGNTGISTGPHLHFVLMKNDKAVNPREYIPF